MTGVLIKMRNSNIQTDTHGGKQCEEAQDEKNHMKMQD
jgi:hypothetical protein